MFQDELKLLLKAVGSLILKDYPEPNPILKELVRETVKFRDKLKGETGQVLTVEDARMALDALEAHLQELRPPAALTPEQAELARILIDKVTLF